MATINRVIDVEQISKDINLVIKKILQLDKAIAKVNKSKIVIKTNYSQSKRTSK